MVCESQHSTYTLASTLPLGIEPSDWETYFVWDQDNEQSRSLYSIPFPQSQASVKRFAEEATVKKPERDNFRFVIENGEKEVVGDITTHNCDQRNGNFSWGINIKQEHRHKGYASEALLLVMLTIFKNFVIKRSPSPFIASMRHLYDYMSVSVSSKKDASEELSLPEGSILMCLFMV